MNKSDSIAKLSQALSKAQSEMPVVRMNAQNPFLKNKYADLGAVIETSRPVLAKHGLSIAQFPTSAGEQIGVTSVLMHESGEYLSETISIPTSDSKGLSVAQSVGVAISYLRRYSWASMLGLYADEDTDGHQPKNENGKDKNTTDAKEAEKKQIALNMYSELVKRGRAVNLELPAMDAGWDSAKMKTHYTEQLGFVKQAEQQAKAGN